MCEKEGRRKRYKANVMATFWEMWVMSIKEFFVLFLQLYYKSEIISKKKELAGSHQRKKKGL